VIGQVCAAVYACGFVAALAVLGKLQVDKVAEDDDAQPMAAFLAVLALAVAWPVMAALFVVAVLLAFVETVHKE
jgi:hypothetical protein